MKNFALVIAFALLAAVPASATEISKAAPATTVGQQTTAEPKTKGAPPLFQIIKRCSALQGTTCPTAGATTACTDGCSNQLSCTCETYYTGYFHNIPSGNYWHCSYEC